VAIVVNNLLPFGQKQQKKRKQILADVRRYTPRAEAAQHVETENIFETRLQQPLDDTIISSPTQKGPEEETGSSASAEFIHEVETAFEESDDESPGTKRDQTS